jgi:hypothetical protein
MDEQPKDYVELDFEKLVEQEYVNLPWYLKVVYHLQDYILIAIASAFALGYLIGLMAGQSQV